jgi:hypothetical protein
VQLPRLGCVEALLRVCQAPEVNISHLGALGAYDAEQLPCLDLPGPAVPAAIQQKQTRIHGGESLNIVTSRSAVSQGEREQQGSRPKDSRRALRAHKATGDTKDAIMML